jgi:hypothetical protein
MNSSIAGELGTIYIQTKDPFGNNLNSYQNASWNLSIPQTQVFFEVEYLDAGVYQISFNTTLAGIFQGLIITINDQNIRNSPSSFVVLPSKSQLILTSD